METMNALEDLEAARDWLRTTNLEEAMQVLGHQGAQTIKRFEVAHQPDSTTAGFVSASFALLGVETVARLAVMARDGQLDSDEADAMVAGVGGALDAARGCFAKHDTGGAREFIEAAMDVLDL